MESFNEKNALNDSTNFVSLNDSTSFANIVEKTEKNDSTKKVSWNDSTQNDLLIDSTPKRIVLHPTVDSFNTKTHDRIQIDLSEKNGLRATPGF